MGYPNIEHRKGTLHQKVRPFFVFFSSRTIKFFDFLSFNNKDIANIWKDDSLEDISNGDTTHFPNEWKDESDEWSDEKQAAREARLAYKGQHDNDFGDLDYHDDHHGSAPDRPVDPAEFSRDWRTEASRIGRFHDDPRFDEDIEMVELDEWSAPKNILKSVIQEMNPLLGDSTADLTREIENVHDINSLSKTISDLKWRVYETQSKNMGNSLLDRASYHTEFEDGFLTQCGFPSGWGKKVNERLERCVRFLQHPPVAKKDATAEEADGLMKFISQFIPNYAA